MLNWFHEIFVKLDFTKKLDVANPKYSHCVVCCCPWVLKTLKFREPECGSRWRGSTQKQWFYFFFRGLTEMRQSIEHTKREISDGYLLVFSWNLISRKFREINFTKISVKLDLTKRNYFKKPDPNPKRTNGDASINRAYQEMMWFHASDVV